MRTSLATMPRHVKYVDEASIWARIQVSPKKCFILQDWHQCPVNIIRDGGVVRKYIELVDELLEDAMLADIEA